MQQSQQLNGKNDESPVRVAIDAMGGDFAPEETVKGAVNALRSANVEIVLVGDKDRVERELAKYDVSGRAVAIVPSEDRIGDDEHPVQSLRRKPKASVVVATQLVKRGDADVMVSIGSTGAAMASSVLALGLMEGLERPCLGGPFLSLLGSNAVLVDIGSNVDCRPGLLLSFGALGAAFARSYMGVQNPRVGLLSVGSEAAKGNRQVQESYPLFQESHLNFVGNVEGMDFFTDKADVIICDGFVGNILIKFTEGLGGALASHLGERLSKILDEESAQKVASDLWQVTNRPRTAGGGPLFGVNGAVVLGHGSCLAEGVEGAVKTAERYVRLGLVDIMRDELTVINQSTGQSPVHTGDAGGGR